MWFAQIPENKFIKEVRKYFQTLNPPFPKNCDFTKLFERDLATTSGYPETKFQNHQMEIVPCIASQSLISFKDDRQTDR